MKRVSECNTKANDVYESLRDAIISGELAPGTRLVIRKIALQLGVSDIPVREALKRLEVEGLVVFKPYAGATVSVPLLRELEEIMEIRGELESFAAASSVDNLTEEDVEELETLLKEMEKCADEGRFWDYSKADRQFHRVLCRRCSNETLIRMLMDLWSQSERARAIFNIMTVSIQASLAEHKEMLEAVRLKDAERLRKVVMKQRERVKISLENFMGKNSSIL